MNNLPIWQQRMYDHIATLMKNDVIVVTAAGNDAEERDGNGLQRSVIDLAPAAFEGPDYPLIVVGATDYTGKPAAFSQGGNHLTVLGPGVDVPTLDKASDAPLVQSGTSFRKLHIRPFLSLVAIFEAHRGCLEQRTLPRIILLLQERTGSSRSGHRSSPSLTWHGKQLIHPHSSSPSPSRKTGHRRSNFAGTSGLSNATDRDYEMLFRTRALTMPM